MINVKEDEAQIGQKDKMEWEYLSFQSLISNKLINFTRDTKEEAQESQCKQNSHMTEFQWSSNTARWIAERTVWSQLIKEGHVTIRPCGCRI